MGSEGEQGQRVELLLGGDAMLGRGVNEAIRRLGPGYPLRRLAPLTRRFDLFLANLECAITARPLQFSGAPKTFYFRADPPAAETLAEAGVDLVSLANNHALDADYDGLRDTLRHLKARGIVHAGAGETPEAAREPGIVEAHGVRVGVLACCDHQPDFAATADRPGIWYLDMDDERAAGELLRAVEALAGRVDHVIVALHWQPNWAPRVGRAYRQLAERLVGAGARLVWGHSPHHLQGVQWIGEAAVIYSAGGLVDDYAVDRKLRNDRSLLFHATLGPGGVERVRGYPIELEYAHPRPAEGEARRWIESFFSRMCGAVGSRVEERDGWLEVLPGKGS